MTSKERAIKKMEVGRLVLNIPFIQKRAAFIRHYPEYSNPEGKVRVSNVFGMRTYDPEIHRKLEGWIDYLGKS